MFVLSRIFPASFAGIFTREPDTVSMAVRGIHTVTLAIIPLSLQYCFVDGFTAIGRTKTALALSMLRKGTYVLSVLFLPLFFGAANAFYAEPICDGLGAAVSTITFLLVFQKHLDRRTAPTDIMVS